LFRSNHRGALILVVLLSAAAWMLAYIAAVAANPVSTLPDTKDHGVGELKINPEKHDFGRVTQLAHSALLTVTATNKSKSASITFNRIASAAPFMIQSDECSGTSLAVGQSCHVEMVFSPYRTGKARENPALIFVDSARNSPQHVELEGFGIPLTPTVTATPTMTPTPPPGATPTTTRTSTPTITPTPKPSFFGHVMDGANPVASSSVAVWAPGTTGYGTGATKFPNTTSTSANDGSFYSGIFNCPSDDTQIYVTAQGGDAGGGANGSLMMMAAVGACDTIDFGVNSFVVNEVTTVGSAYALDQFLSTSTPGSVGAPASAAAGLADAFATLASLVDPTTGTALSGASQETLNSIANALAACDQTDGASSPACTELFNCALPGAVFNAGACTGGTGSVTDTLTAALSIALNPASVSVDGIYDVSTKAAVYSPALTSAPPDWSLP
jgi:hypothetical protein